MITPAYAPTATERVLPRMALDFTTGVLDSRVTVARSLNTATRVNSSGLIEIVNANLPRFDYDPVTLAAKGLLIEETRTNLLTYSSEFDNASWVKSSTTVTANSINGPDGTLSADTIASTASVNNNINKTVNLSLSTAYTFSLFLKAGTSTRSRVLIFDTVGAVTIADVSINWTSGVPSFTARSPDYTQKSLVSFGNGWYRFTGTFTSSATNVAHRCSLYPDFSSGVNNVNAYGADLEAGAFATSYIPTTTTSLTRNADVVSMTGTNFSDWYNQTEGSFVFQYSRYQNTDAFGIVLETKPSSTSTANRFGAAATSTADPRFQLVPNGTSILDTGGTFGVLPVNTVVKGAFAYRSGDSAATRNGASPSNSATAFATPTYTNLQIGGTDNGLYGPPTTSQLNGHIRSIRYYPQRIINAEVQSFSK
jgi:hypothetical protein